MTTLPTIDADRNDPNIKIPDAIKERAAKADELHKAIYAPETEQKGPEEKQPALSATAAAAVVQSAVAQPQAQPKSERPINAADPVAEPSGDGNDETWEHKYNSARGRHERAEKAVLELSNRLATMQAAYNTMEASLKTATSQPVTEEKFVTPEEEADFGTELLSVVGKKAKEELLPLLTEQRKKIADLEAQLSGVNGYVAQDAKARMMASLDQSIPKWKEINKNPEFLSWLQLPDPYSGVIRHTLLKEAYGQNSSPRVQAFFNGFLTDKAAVDPARAEPDKGVTSKKIPLETLAAPGRARTAASSPAEKPIITRTQIANFYADLAAKRYSGREAEAQRIEAQIFEAQREGRIR